MNALTSVSMTTVYSSFFLLTLSFSQKLFSTHFLIHKINLLSDLRRLLKSLIKALQ